MIGDPPSSVGTNHLIFACVVDFQRKTNPVGAIGGQTATNKAGRRLAPHALIAVALKVQTSRSASGAMLCSNTVASKVLQMSIQLEHMRKLVI